MGGKMCKKREVSQGKKDREQRDESRKQQKVIIIISTANSPFLIQRESEQKHKRAQDKSQILSVMLTPSCTDLCKNQFSKSQMSLHQSEVFSGIMWQPHLE